MLGLLVSGGGYPLSYSLFNGSQYEGRTMMPIIEDFVHRFDLEDFVVVADSGLMNKSNLELLEQSGYNYIIGARIKNETDEVKQWVFSLEKVDGVFYEHFKGERRLIVCYSEKRAKKDYYNRQKGIRRLQKAYKNGSITKENINKRGYNKFLDISDDVKVTINSEKIGMDEKWDGLKRYITNTNLAPKDVYAQYNELWVVERAFRVTKGTLEVRPMFHFNPVRIEAHVCICFVAYKVYKELERIIRLKQINLSIDKVLSIARTITTIKINLPTSGKVMSKTMILTEQQRSIASLFDEKFWENL
ncbi:transposase [Bacteroides sp. 224]|uniref:IS1634 family transposase n=1 Tax=Bacteroides sp. 224 TaxID=2302936 RepID=UPI00351AC916